jgi:small subunit ribosomal protein S17
MAKSIIGIVSSDKTDKTIVVSVATQKTHPIYKKQYTSTKKFMAHDENNEANEGDRVSIQETRPISKRKHFTLVKIVERAPVRHVETLDEEVAEAAGQKKEIRTEDVKETPEKKEDES